MKLESSLRFRPGLFLTVPLVDLFGVLLLFFLLGSSLVLQSGVRLELPPSSFALQGMAEARVLVVSGGELPRLVLDNEEIGIEDVPARFDELARLERQERGRVASLLIKADRTTPHGLVLALGDMALARGFRVALVTLPEDGT